MPLTYSVWPDKSRASLFFHLRLYGLVFTKPCIASHGTFFKSGCVFPSCRPCLISVTLSLLLFSRQVMSNSLQPRGLQHARFPCPSVSPGVFSDSCPLSQWSHTTISFSVAHFSSCPLSFPALGSFPVSQFFASRGQHFGAFASASVLPVNIQSWFPSGLTGLIFCPRDSQESSPAPQFKSMNSLVLQLSHPYMTSGKTIALTRWTFLGEVSSLVFNMVPRFVIPFMSRLAAALSWQRACITLWRHEPCGAGPRKTDRS